MLTTEQVEGTGDTRYWLFSVEAVDLEAHQAEPCAERFGHLVEQLCTILPSEVALLVAPDASYEVNPHFLALLCAKLSVASNNHKVAITCRKCKVCKTYHQPRHLAEWGKELERRIAASPTKQFIKTAPYFTQLEWKSILRPVPSQCVLKGRTWLPAAIKGNAVL